MKAAVRLIAFDSQSIDVIRDKVPAVACAELASRNYQPRASTPLLDTVGHGVAMPDKHKQPVERCILAVMTTASRTPPASTARKPARCCSTASSRRKAGWSSTWAAITILGRRRTPSGCTPAT